MKKIFALTACLFLLTIGSMAQKTFTVTGYVTDQNSGETLLNAVITDMNARKGTAANSFGFYSLSLAPGKHRLEYFYPGYSSRQISLNLQKDTLINIALRTAPEQTLHAACVYGESKNSIMATGMGATDISMDMVKHTPSLFGETDVMRTIQLLPGVQSGVNGSTGLFVRGGNGDQNLILLDGAPLYKVDHALGFFSVFTPEAIKKATFYKSSFPARYAGRLSSVIDARTKNGDMQRFHGAFSLGLLSSRFHIEGPITKNKTSFSLSARRSYIDLLAAPFMKKDERNLYRLLDVNAKINHKFSDRDRVYFSFYQGSDLLQLANSWAGSEGLRRTFKINMDWGNRLLSLKWNHVFGGKLFGNIMLNYTRYQMLQHNKQTDFLEKGRTTNTRSQFNSSIKDWSAQCQFDYYPSAEHHLIFGANYTRHFFLPAFSSVNIEERSQDAPPSSSSETAPFETWRADEPGAYIEDNWRISDEWQTDFGLSASAFLLKEKKYAILQPRVSLRWQPLENWTFKAAFSQMAQFIHQLTSGNISLPTDLWVPITKNIHPMNASQYSIGAYFSGIPGWEFSTELYYKKMSNVIDYKDGMGFFGFAGDWQNMIATGKGMARGIEFMIRKKYGRNTGWISYTLSQSLRRYGKNSGINAGNWFPDMFDRRHVVNVAYTCKVNDKFSLDASWNFASGGLATISLKKAQYITPGGSFEGDYVSHRNNYRLPPSHTLNLGANFVSRLKHRVKRTWNISIYNAYNHMNPMFVYSDIDENHLQKITILPFLPSFTLKYEF